MNSELLPRHEIWRQMYRENRYCRHLGAKELEQRFRDVFLNNLRLTPEGKVSLPPLGLEGIRGMELWTHVLEEMALRYGPPPNGFNRDIFHLDPFPDFVGELGLKSASVLSARNLKPGEVLIKFGKVEHMREFFERGAIQVQPASYYATPSHNGAIRDDELSLPLSLSVTREDIVRVVVNPHEVPNETINQRLDITFKSNSDYWLYCLTTAVEPRLFVDFQADSCVIIKDRERFVGLVTLGGTRGFPRTVCRHGSVTYVDPLLPAKGVVDVPMSKHFRYEYQKEFRFVWYPVRPAADLLHVDLEVGSLEGLAELVVL